MNLWIALSTQDWRWKPYRSWVRFSIKKYPGHVWYLDLAWLFFHIGANNERYRHG